MHSTEVVSSSSSGRLSGRAKGYAFGIFGVLCVSPDAMLCRLPHPDEEVLLVTAWRTAWVGLFCTATVIIQQRGRVHTLIQRIHAHAKPLAVIGLMSSTAGIGFPLALQLTGSAEALLLISLSPLWGSLIGWKFLGDRLPLRTKMAVFGALISIGLIFTPTILGGAEEHPRPNRLLGDILAVMTGIGLGSYGNAVRYFAPRHPQMPTQAAQILSNGTACMISLIVAAASGRPFVFHEPERLWWITMLMGLIINAAYLGFNVAPKYINAAEFGIICLLEAVLGPVFVFLLVREVPSVWTVTGGAVLLSTMALHEVATMSHQRATARASARLVADTVHTTEPSQEGIDDAEVGTTTKSVHVQVLHEVRAVRSGSAAEVASNPAV